MATSGGKTSRQLVRALLRRHEALHRRRAWRIGVLAVLGALSALGIFTQSVHFQPTTIFFFYVFLAAWYGDEREALGAALFGLIVTLVRIPNNARLGFSFQENVAAELLFVVACLVQIVLVQSLRKHRALAEAAVRTRDDFLATALHDLRAPLTALLGRVDLVQRRIDSGKAVDEAWLRAQMVAAQAAAIRMLSLVGEFGDVARLEMAQTLELHREVVDLSDLIRTVAEELDSQHEAPLVMAITPGITVAGDRARLERVAENIIGNAFKYSTGGTPVYVEVAEDAQGVRINVRDSGVGIPAGELPKIFTRYFRASTAAGVAGSGLGLAGAKAIVEQHGGRISVQSAPGRGTTVTIWLPRGELY